MSETIIKADKAVIRQQKVTILKDVTLEIESGEFIYIIGKVGSGKSSFLKTLYAELPLEYGNLEVAGFQLKKLKNPRSLYCGENVELFFRISNYLPTGMYTRTWNLY